eukprot:CAMPEP_0117422272 /NCGR_PEP_ID=MMETSP0758-20121206/3149_1 /TAXON_ID=63605 /ORGANISM="Percolomonas cosmopolitus, Strain AE-1 (ATCC 50343)" /LENGTH=133 /DNA_ID=CAMNT_0005204801 /DNA_START=746 /DNA_END=1143 /DNA_ORIENTATION=+
MSNDFVKMEVMKKKLSKIVQHQEMRECTFEPQLITTDKNESSKSVVKQLQSSSKAFHAYLDERDRKLELKRRISDLVDLKRDLKSCTFSPETGEAPEYIHQLAATYAMTKIIRQQFQLPHPSSSTEESPSSPP